MGAPSASRHALDFRVLTGSRVLVFDASESLFCSAQPQPQEAQQSGSGAPVGFRPIPEFGRSQRLLWLGAGAGLLPMLRLVSDWCRVWRGGRPHGWCSSSSLYLRDIFHSTGDGKQLTKVRYGLRSRRTHQGFSPTTRVVPYTVHGASSPLSRTSIPQLSRASRMRSRRLERDARPAPSIATVVTPPKVQERVIRVKRLTRKKLNGQAPSVEQVTPMGVVIPKYLKNSAHLFFPTLQSPSSHSCSSSALRLIFSMSSS